MKSILALLVGVLFALPVSLHAQEKKVLRAGAATSNITPEIGGLIVGGFNPDPSTHIHDDLHVRCLVLDNGETKIAWAVCDLLGGDRDMFQHAGELVEKETGIPRANIMMSATHTHSAASALGANRYAMPRPPLDPYQTFVARRIADGIKRALNNLQPARIGWASGQEPDQVFNRRWFMKPGTMPVNPFGEYDQVKMNPPRGSKDLDRPAGPTDPEVSVISLQSLDGRPIAVLANYSLHYVGGVGNGHVSADYFGYFCSRLAELMQAERQDVPFVAILSNGTSGDINNIDFTQPAPKTALYEKMKLVANDVAQVAFEAVKTIQYQDWVPLQARFRELEVGTRLPTTAQLERARGLVQTPRVLGAKATLERIYAERTLSLEGYPKTITIPVQAFRVGSLSVTAIPCETFVQTGLDLKARSPLKPNFTHSIANGYFGYLPTPEHHKLGGYETWLGTNRLEVQASVKITDALLEMLTEMAK